MRCKLKNLVLGHFLGHTSWFGHVINPLKIVLIVLFYVHLNVKKERKKIEKQEKNKREFTKDTHTILLWCIIIIIHRKHDQDETKKNQNEKRKYKNKRYISP